MYNSATALRRQLDTSGDSAERPHYAQIALEECRAPENSAALSGLKLRLTPIACAGCGCAAEVYIVYAGLRLYACWECIATTTKDEGADAVLILCAV